MKDERDHIIEFAFDELTGANADELRTRVEGSRLLRQEAEAYRELKSELASLRAIPECQVSTERLRDAILSTGIKPKSRSRSLWVWAAPLAATALAIVAFLRFPGIADGDASGPRAAISTPSGSVSGPLAYGKTPEGDKSDVMGSRTPVVVRPTASNVPATIKRVNRSKRVKPGVRRASASIAATTKHGTTVPGVTVVPTPPENADIEATEPIVIISADRDAATGANRATEELEDTNVVIGG